MNVKADEYVAVFGVAEEGETVGRMPPEDGRRRPGVHRARSRRSASPVTTSSSTSSPRPGSTGSRSPATSPGRSSSASS